jgi:hypothetical protein
MIWPKAHPEASHEKDERSALLLTGPRDVAASPAAKNVKVYIY